MKKWIKSFVVALMLMIPIFIAGWYSGSLSAYKRGENRGYEEGYKCASNELFEARDKYFEARIELRVALMDLMEYKLKLQEKEGGK